MKEYMNEILDELEFNESSPFYRMCQVCNISIKDEEGNFKCLWEIFRELNEKIK